ncbi:hypothetical protein KC19_4G258700 [Ceratodon purpureus]|uniref:Pectinesterase n=1 Tax=Ceratodon purpureus TaxID=3225 RepID=A0A8T0IG54_CERPU|nr:hypothetical protein KC19_4G258700 [Ceratodon purpureus]
MARLWSTSILVLVCLSFLSLILAPVHSTLKTPSTRDEVVASFQSWVDRVGAKTDAETILNKTEINLIPCKAGDTVPERVIVVDQNGGGDYTTINEAFSAVPPHNIDPITIKVLPGTYFERVVVPKNKRCITLQGAGRDVTKITSSFVANDTGTTYTTSTFGVSASYFTARNISFENSSPPPNGKRMHQAVALRTTGDFNAFYGCAFYGQQDTLYDARGRHYFKDTLIVGSVDFIFGDGKSLYKDCELRVLSHRGGSITAQKRHNFSEDTGYSFVNCRVTGSGPATAYLGRAWGPYSRVVFALTEFADIIDPVGWYSWDAARESTVFYGEYKCFGPGANESHRVKWAHELNDTEAQPFVSLDYINGGLWVTEE